MSITNIIETITPAKAARYLERNLKNRPIKLGRVQQYVRVLESGHWHVTHQGIAFDVNDELIDGQTRLTAVVKSGVTIRMFVGRGFPLEAVLGVDQGSVRTAADIATFVGDSSVTRNHVAACRAMFGMDYFVDPGNHQARILTLTHQEVLELINEYRDAIFFACGLPVARLRGATFFAVIARAWYTANCERLAEFGKIIGSGMPEGRGDSAAVALRNWYFQSQQGSRAERILTYRKAESALQAFLEKRPLSRVMEATEELFPLPGEPSKRKRTKVAEKEAGIQQQQLQL